MKKILVPLMILLVSLIILIGCSSNEEEPSMNIVEDNDSEVPVTDKDDSSTTSEKSSENISKSSSEEELDGTDEETPIDCGKCENSVYEKEGYIAITQDMEDMVQDEALECFGEKLLSDECVETTIEITHYTQTQGGSQEKTDYKYTLFEKNGDCYIKRESIACQKNLSLVAEDYESLDISPESVINTFTEHYLNELHMKMQGIKTGFVEDKNCFTVE